MSSDITETYIGKAELRFFDEKTANAKVERARLNGLADIFIPYTRLYGKTLVVANAVVSEYPRSDVLPTLYWELNGEWYLADSCSCELWAVYPEYKRRIW